MGFTLNLNLQCREEEPIVRISYFMPDLRKEGGSYLEVVGKIKLIDQYNRIVIMQNGDRIPIDDIISIDGDLFDEQ